MTTPTQTLKDILALNNGKKFDVCLMNPPYGARKSGNENLHFEFVEKCLEIVEKMEVIMPFRMYQSTNKKYDKYNEKFKKSLISVEEVDARKTFNIGMDSCGIYDFNSNKENDKEPKIIYTSDINKRFNFSDYEKEILEYLENTDISKMRAHFQNPGKEKKTNKEYLLSKCQSLLNRFKDKHIYLTTNLANGGMNATFISKTVGKIFDNPNDLCNDWMLRNGSGMVILVFKSKKEAENCRTALQNPLLRFGLYKLQDDQNMHARVYKYVPDIDWSNSKCTTDEGLLELCGCPKDKCKEYAEYCKKIIEEVDKK